MLYIKTTMKDFLFFRTLAGLFSLLGLFGLKIQPNAWENYRILYHKTNKEASTVVCSVLKHLGSCRALKK